MFHVEHLQNNLSLLCYLADRENSAKHHRQHHDTPLPVRCQEELCDDPAQGNNGSNPTPRPPQGGSAPREGPKQQPEQQRQRQAQQGLTMAQNCDTMTTHRRRGRESDHFKRGPARKGWPSFFFTQPHQRAPGTPRRSTRCHCGAYRALGPQWRGATAQRPENRRSAPGCLTAAARAPPHATEGRADPSAAAPLALGLRGVLPISLNLLV